MEANLKILEETILDEYLNLVHRVQPELEKHFFYDVMPPRTTRTNNLLR